MTITFLNNKYDLKLVEIADNRVGSIYYLQKEIVIDRSLDFEAFKIVLIHELTHAYLESTGQGHTDSFSQEAICDLVPAVIKQIEIDKIDIKKIYKTLKGETKC